MPQKAVLFTGTIRDNLKWGKPDATDEELWQALETAQARDFVEEKPGGLDEPVLPGGKELLRRPAAAADHCPGPGAQTGDFDFG